MDVLPLSLKLTGQPCLVVGGGAVAGRKIELLTAAGATVSVVAREASTDVRQYCQAHGVRLRERAFREADVAGCRLVVAATNDATVNQAIRDACEREGVLVNVVDDGERSSVLFPAIVDRGSVTVAIATGGASPTLARRLRERIESVLPTSLGALANYLSSRRQRIREALPSSDARRRFWDAALDSPLSALAGQGEFARADALLDAALETPDSVGLVSLVGAGPGDADLLTVKALRCLQRADVVYYDDLVSSDVLDRCRRDAKRVYVGRRAGTATSTQARQRSINESLVADAQDGKRVVRLKGGDPLVFGRAGEELAALTAHRVAFEVVPGITAALGCAAVAGVPLTHRDWAQSLRFVTARVQDGSVNLDWPELAKPAQTLVIYMGLGALAEVCASLLSHGIEPDTPAATITRGTLPEQRIVTARVDELAAKVRAAALSGPATTIVGRVVAFAPKG